MQQELKIFVTLFLVFSATVYVQAQLLGNNPPFCDEVLSELASKRIRTVFQTFNGVFVDRKVVGRLCINPFNFRVQALFYCPEGYAAQVIDTATNIELSNGVIDRSSSGSLSPPIDLDDLSEALNTTVAVLCNEIPTPAPPNIGSCPSGPTRMRSYIRAHHTRLCRYTCSFGVAAQGASIGTRSRTIYWCCKEYGDPILLSRASRLYGCGPLN